MQTNDASFAQILYRKIGRALELIRTATNPRDKSYWEGHMDALLDLCNKFEASGNVLMRADVDEAFAAFDFEDRVNEAVAGDEPC